MVIAERYLGPTPMAALGRVQTTAYESSEMEMPAEEFAFELIPEGYGGLIFDEHVAGTVARRRQQPPPVSEGQEHVATRVSRAMTRDQLVGR